MLTCAYVVVELRGFEPLTPCMPCHPHPFTTPSVALPSPTSALLSQDAGRGTVVRREAARGIVADNLLTDYGLRILSTISVSSGLVRNSSTQATTAAAIRPANWVRPPIWSLTAVRELLTRIWKDWVLI
jgi:hypothetical protein